MASHDSAPGPVTSTRTTDRQRRWALVTGATGGIGSEFARYLATHGADLVLTGRDTVKLGALAHELSGTGARIMLMPVDLEDRQSRVQLHQSLVDQGVVVDTLVNNAGYGIIDSVAETDPDALLGMLEVNVTALTHLTRLFLPAMIEAGAGSIINVASTASYQPIPAMAAYAASKSYVRSFSVALWHETKGTGVRVVAISPGPTESEFFSRAGNDGAFKRRRTPADVVATTFAALADHRPTVVDGVQNQAMAFANRLVPERVATAVAHLMAKR